MWLANSVTHVPDRTRLGVALGIGDRGHAMVWVEVRLGVPAHGAFATPLGSRRRKRPLRRRHRNGVPMADAVLEIAGVAQQRRAGGAEAELGILEKRLAGAHGVEEVAHVDLVRIAGRGELLLRRAAQAGRGHGLQRILFAVGANVLLFSLFGERVGGVARLLLARDAI